MLNLINWSNEIIENQQNLNFINFVNFRELAITNFKHNLSINHYKSINYLTVISKYICMRIDLLHSLWYLLNFLLGLLRPKHFNLEMKQYYSGAREEGKLCTFPHPYLVTELSADACCRVSVVYFSQLMCTAASWCELQSANVYCSQLMCTAVSWCVLLSANVYCSQLCVLQTAESTDMYFKVSCQLMRAAESVLCTAVSWCVL